MAGGLNALLENKGDLLTRIEEALAYASHYNGSTSLVKCGGETVDDETRLDNVLRQIIYMARAGINVPLVHGGGKQITKRLKAEGVESKFENGIRVTSEDAVKYTTEELKKLNAHIVNRINELAAEETGVPSQMPVRAVGMGAHEVIKARRQPQYDQVGIPEQMDVSAITQCFGNEGEILIPVIHPMCEDMERSGVLLNVNADNVAGALAVALQAERMFFCTDVSGVKDLKGDVISTLPTNEARMLIEYGVASGGMIPKLETMIGATEKGVGGTAIISSAEPHGMIAELFLREGGGTLLTRPEASSTASPAALPFQPG